MSGLSLFKGSQDYIFHLEQVLHTVACDGRLHDVKQKGFKSLHTAAAGERGTFLSTSSRSSN